MEIFVEYQEHFSKKYQCEVITFYILVNVMTLSLQGLERNKKDFVKYSKNFSDTLKQYFKDQRLVFIPALWLVQNEILKLIKD